MFEGAPEKPEASNDNGEAFLETEKEKYDQYLKLVELAPEQAKAFLETVADLPRRERVVALAQEISRLNDSPQENRVLMELLSQVSTIEIDLDNLERHRDTYTEAYALVQK